MLITTTKGDAVSGFPIFMDRLSHNSKIIELQTYHLGRAFHQSLIALALLQGDIPAQTKLTIVTIAETGGGFLKLKRIGA